MSPWQYGIANTTCSRWIVLAWQFGPACKYIDWIAGREPMFWLANLIPTGANPGPSTYPASRCDLRGQV
jgi:hypothetical protein